MRRRTRRCTGYDGSNFVLLDQDVSKIGFDPEHVFFVRDDDAVELLAVFQADFVGAGRQGDGKTECAKRSPSHATVEKDAHSASMCLGYAPLQLAVRGWLRPLTWPFDRPRPRHPGRE